MRGSALTGEGLPALLTLIDEQLTGERRVIEVRLDPADGALLAWLYRHGEVLSRRDEPEGTRLRVLLDPTVRARFEHRRGTAAASAADGRD